MKINIKIDGSNSSKPIIEFDTDVDTIEAIKLDLSSESNDELDVLYDLIISNIDNIELKKSYKDTEDSIYVHVANQIHTLLLKEIQEIKNAKSGVVFENVEIDKLVSKD